MPFAIAVFYLSLAGIVGLFGIKYWEQKREIGFVSSLRERADKKAAQIKDLVADGKAQAVKILPTLILFARFAVREAALGTARFARMLEENAYRLADLVSHKHHFEKKETKSEFLKQVSKYKNGRNRKIEPESERK